MQEHSRDVRVDVELLQSVDVELVHSGNCSMDDGDGMHKYDANNREPSTSYMDANNLGSSPNTMERSNMSNKDSRTMSILQDG